MYVGININGICKSEIPLLFDEDVTIEVLKDIYAKLGLIIDINKMKLVRVELSTFQE